MNTKLTQKSNYRIKRKALIKSYMDGWILAQKNLTLTERAEAIQSFRHKK